jgi:hypothetical protein
MFFNSPYMVDEWSVFGGRWSVTGTTIVFMEKVFSPNLKTILITNH